MVKKGAARSILAGLFLFTLFISLGGQTELGGMAGAVMANEPDVILTKQDNGKEITLKVGQVIQVQLEGIGGTGYWWYVENLDPRYWELLSEKTRAASDGRMGGPVLGLWTFRAKEPGTAEIALNYYRTWEGVGKASDHFGVRIKIQ